MVVPVSPAPAGQSALPLFCRLPLSYRQARMVATINANGYKVDPLGHRLSIIRQDLVGSHLLYSVVGYHSGARNISQMADHVVP